MDQSKVQEVEPVCHLVSKLLHYAKLHLKKKKKKGSSGPVSLRGLKMTKAAMCLLIHQGVLAPVTVVWLAEATQVREMKVLGQFLSQK